MLTFRLFYTWNSILNRGSGCAKWCYFIVARLFICCTPKLIWAVATQYKSFAWPSRAKRAHKPNVKLGPAKGMSSETSQANLVISKQTCLLIVLVRTRCASDMMPKGSIHISTSGFLVGKWMYPYLSRSRNGMGATGENGTYGSGYGELSWAQPCTADWSVDVERESGRAREREDGSRGCTLFGFGVGATETICPFIQTDILSCCYVYMLEIISTLQAEDMLLFSVPSFVVVVVLCRIHKTYNISHHLNLKNP